MDCVVFWRVCPASWCYASWLQSCIGQFVGNGARWRFAYLGLAERLVPDTIHHGTFGAHPWHQLEPSRGNASDNGQPRWHGKILRYQQSTASGKDYHDVVAGVACQIHGTRATSIFSWWKTKNTHVYSWIDSIHSRSPMVWSRLLCPIWVVAKTACCCGTIPDKLRRFARFSAIAMWFLTLRGDRIAATTTPTWNWLRGHVIKRCACGMWTRAYRKCVSQFPSTKKVSPISTAIECKNPWWLFNIHFCLQTLVSYWITHRNYPRPNSIRSRYHRPTTAHCHCIRCSTNSRCSTRIYHTSM